MDKNKLSLPSPEDITDPKILELIKRLKGESEKETLTNILEWQDRNIRFWFERWTIPLNIIFLSFGIPVVIVLTIFLSFIIILFALVAFYIGIDILKVASGAMTLSRTIIETITIRNVLEFSIILFIILIIYLFILKFTRYKRMEWKTIYYTLVLTLPVNKILEYKLALCRDYAKLTSSLLFNLYPDSEVYFIKTPWHETVGMKFKDEIYVLDQRLPISTLDNDRYANADIFSTKRDSTGNINLIEKPKWTKRKALSEINTEELTEEITRTLKIKQNSHKDKPDFNIPLEKYAKFYYYDEIIKYSLIRAIKNRLENEFCDGIHKISKVTISRNKEDLMLEVYYEGG